VNNSSRGNTSAPPGQDPGSPGRAAGPLRRLGALLYDGLLLLGLWLAASGLVLALAPDGPGAARRRLVQGAVLAATALFYGYFWTHGGQTLGMRAWRLRLVGLEGGPVGWGRALARLAAAPLAWLPLGLGVWWCLLDPRGLAWHDRLSGTRPVPAPPGGRPR